MTKLKFYYFILFIASFFLSCEENNPVDPYGQTSQVYVISGNLNGWNLGSNKNVIFLGAHEIWNSDKIYSVSEIDSDGNFYLKNLGSPSDVMFLNPVCPQFSEEIYLIRNTLTCSDSSARKVWGYLVITLADDTSFTNKGDINRRNFNDWFYFSDDSVKSGDFIVEYIFADKNARLYGTIEYEYTNVYSNKKYHFTLEYNMNYQKGWNKEITQVKYQQVCTDSGFTNVVSTRSISNYEPIGARWDYSYYGN